MNITVKQPESHNVQALKKIWKECFGDSDEYINNFFDKAFKPEYALVAMIDFKPVGMLYTLPSLLKFKNKEYMGEYIYAVGVNQKFRKMGVMTAMENKATELAQSQGLSFMTLIPQDKELYKLYEGVGYKTAFYNSVRSYMPFKAERLDGISIRPCDLFDFKELRESYLSKMPMYVDFLPPFDNYRFDEIKMVGANAMLAVLDGKKHYFVGFKRGNIYLIKETNMSETDIKRVLPLIANEYQVDVVSVRGRSKGVVDTIAPYAMYKSFDNEINFNEVKSNRAYINMMLD